MSIVRILTALTLLVAAGSAMAHPGHGAGFVSGFAHPLGGIDHLFAMVAIGLVAARQRGVLRWALPVGFIAAMLAGALLGAEGFALPQVESGVAASVLILGLLIAFMVRLPFVAALSLVVVMALFHGQAHQAEMPAGSSIDFATGFVIATASLHLFGFMLARWMPNSLAAQSLKRALGAGIAAAGLLLLAA